MNFEIALSVSEKVDEPHVKSGLRVDQPAFQLFYEQTAGSLLGYLVRVCGERGLAEDLCQESYCRFLTADAPAMDERQARSYLFQIATNLMRDPLAPSPRNGAGRRRP